MTLVFALLAGFSMNLATIMMHVTSVSLLLPHVRTYAVERGLRRGRFGPNAVIGASIFGLLALQLISAVAWSGLYFLLRIAPSFGAAFYLALTTISALGGDDAAVHSQWRVLLPMSSINGALLFGLSTAVMFRLVAMFHIADDFPRATADKGSGVDPVDREVFNIFTASRKADRS